VEARAGPFQVASTHGDGYVLPRTRHPMMMMMRQNRATCTYFSVTLPPTQQTTGDTFWFTGGDATCTNSLTYLPVSLHAQKSMMLFN